MPFQPSTTGASDRHTPVMYEASSSYPERNPALQTLIDEVRAQSDCLVILSGGASDMSPVQQDQIAHVLEALTVMGQDGRRIAVGDGGTHSGVMAAAGMARLASGNRFPLVGITPAGEVPPHGGTPLDPNHSHIVVVSNPSSIDDGWGSETKLMYWLLDRIAEGRPSVAVVVNGGEITLDEVAANLEAERHVILIESSGRAADALIALLTDSHPTDDDILRLKARAARADLARRPELFHVVPISAGPVGLRNTLVRLLGHVSLAS